MKEIIKKKYNKSLAALVMALVLLLPNTVAFSQTQSKTDQQLELERQLKEIQAQIDQYSKDLKETTTQKKTLQNKIKQLQITQKALQAQIKETAIRINDIENKMDDTEIGIKKNTLKEQTLNAAISASVRRMNEIDNNFLVALVTAEGFSSFLNQIHEYSAVSASLSSLHRETKNLRIKLQDLNDKLEGQKEDANNLLQIKSIQQEKLLGTIGDQSNLLEATKGREQEYQNVIADTKARAAEIRSRIYELFNVGKQITFGEAVEVAKWASGITGVRGAFIMAILTQESNLGKNVGTCNRVGDPPEKGWKVIMKPERDQEPFKSITDSLGLDPDITPVSCPMRDKYGKQIGWGGAMGPAQFIPSTWMGYKDKVSSYTGKTPADPWDIRDAFLAAALLLKNLGANGTDDGEWKAAMRYFSGSTNTKYRFYGDNVLSITKQYLQDIADLN